MMQLSNGKFRSGMLPHSVLPGRKNPSFSLNVQKVLRDLMRWERQRPPQRLYLARAPIHPSAIWLDPSGCPPGRVSHFWGLIIWELPLCVIARYCAAPNACGALTTKWAFTTNLIVESFPLFFVRCDRIIATFAGQRKSFPQNTNVTSVVIRVGCVCVRSSLCGLNHDTTTRRGTGPRNYCAVVQPG